MTRAAEVLMVAAAALAVGDWVAVARDDRRLERVCKPAALAALVGVAVVLDPADPLQRRWFVVALLLSLAGDVLLMVDRFVPGLVAFLVAHGAYIAGLSRAVTDPRDALVPAVVVVVAAVPLLWRVLRAVHASHEPQLAGPVALYAVVISAMVVTAGATRQPVAIAGAALFYGSDLTIAWRRFVRPRPWMPVAIMVTYHLGQALLVTSLVAR